jgi:hypothetical protein
MQDIQRSWAWTLSTLLPVPSVNNMPDACCCPCVLLPLCPFVSDVCPAGGCGPRPCQLRWRCWFASLMQLSYAILRQVCARDLFAVFLVFAGDCWLGAGQLCWQRLQRLQHHRLIQQERSQLRLRWVGMNSGMFCGWGSAEEPVAQLCRWCCCWQSPALRSNMRRRLLKGCTVSGPAQILAARMQLQQLAAPSVFPCNDRVCDQPFTTAASVAGLQAARRGCPAL